MSNLVGFSPQPASLTLTHSKMSLPTLRRNRPVFDSNSRQFMFSCGKATGTTSKFERHRQCQMACVCVLAAWPTNPRSSKLTCLPKLLRGMKGVATGTVTNMELGAVVRYRGVRCTEAQLRTIINHVGGTINLPGFLLFVGARFVEPEKPENPFTTKTPWKPFKACTSSTPSRMKIAISR